MIEYFEEFGLETNEIKTKYMILRGEATPRALSKNIYDKIKRIRGTRIGRRSNAEKEAGGKVFGM